MDIWIILISNNLQELLWRYVLTLYRKVHHSNN